MKLTAQQVKAITEPGKYYDRDGLILRVAPGGSKQWVWRGTVHGRRVELGMGSVRFTSLAEAREIAFDYVRTARRGGDPRTRRPGSEAPTFCEAVESVIETHRPGWKNDRSETNWRRPLTYAKSLDGIAVNAINTADLTRVLLPIWHDKPETARKLRTRLGMVMRWAIAEGHRSDDPAGPALTAALPRHTTPRKHHASLPHDEIGEVLEIVGASLRVWRPTVACLRFVVATACRSGEAREARWSEIDGDTWTIPEERTKTSRPLVVPLSTMALAALEDARLYADGSGLIFPSPRGRVLSDNTMSKLLREHGVAATVHGMRASFRSWAAENGVSREVAEAALGHVAGKIERAYQRSDLLAARAEVMQRWADHLDDA
ncbi:MAG: tyrosine-type recombinase/integrase [Acidimicrobiaceae bacterium]|nr:tyrosine-type recombinase/integrase [Acidimicrobiaceae bacterium]MYI36056.1 tyrosine-type recombinase/integrase [Acidimicrobiaceae bacterium]